MDLTASSWKFSCKLPYVAFLAPFIALSFAPCILTPLPLSHYGKIFTDYSSWRSRWDARRLCCSTSSSVLAVYPFKIASYAADMAHHFKLHAQYRSGRSLRIDIDPRR